MNREHSRLPIGFAYATDQSDSPDNSCLEMDMSDMQNNLQKLKGLSAEDKTEKAMLRSRIDEQSQLIMILKKRADEVSEKTRTVDRINKELVDFRDSSKDMLDYELKKSNMLSKRFDELAYNHEEMIKIKDEYKRSNKELREENARLKEDNARLFSGAIQEKDQQIADLERKMSEAKQMCTSLEQRNRQSVQDFRVKEDQMRAEIKTLQDKYNADMKLLQNKLQQSEEHLKGANYKLQNQMENNKSLDADTQKKIQQLTKEKDEMLDLAMSRGKIVQKEQTENKKLMKKVEDMEKAVRNMEEKFERESASVNSNLQVRKLRDDVEESNQAYKELQSDFDAFKKHSNKLLQRERDINEKLKHLVG